MIAISAAIRFSEGHIPDKIFHVITFLVNDVEIDGGRIGLEGLLSFDALCVGMDVVSVEKTKNIKSFISKNSCRVYAAWCTTDMKKDLHLLSPKIAVPIRTRVAPSSMATSKSPVMPMESSFRTTPGKTF
jgi:hypothetical protein